VAKRGAAAAPEAKPKDEQPKEKEPKSEAKMAVNGRLDFIEVLHVTRVLSPRGGPWSEGVVAATIADRTISQMMASGFDLVSARHVTVVPDGIFMAWLLGKPKGRPTAGMTEVVHVMRTIKGNLGAIPPALSTMQANDYIEGYLNDGWSLINNIDGFQPVASDPNGLSVLWVLVR
jgi:hypothetical protein